MTTSVIKQIVTDRGDGTQSVKMIVRSNERGPKGDKGDKGDAATIEAGQAYSVNPDLQPSVMNVGTENHAKFDFYIPKGKKGDRGDDGAIHYTAGTGIRITNNNVIQATGAAVATWGGIEGAITDQTDLAPYIQQTIGDSLSYSTTEIDTGAKWIDGSTIYKKTFTWESQDISLVTGYLLPTGYKIGTVIEATGSLEYMHPTTQQPVHCVVPGVTADENAPGLKPIGVKYSALNMGQWNFDTDAYLESTTGHITFLYTKEQLW